MSTSPLSAFSLPASAGQGLPPRPSRLDKLSRDTSPMDRVRTAAQEEFASLLSQSMAAKSGSAATKATSAMSEAEKDDQARQAAQDFVAVAFVQPILKGLRNSNIGGELAPPLGPGPGEKQFRSLADSQVARQLVKASNWPLVDSLTKTLRSKRHDPLTPDAVANAPALPGSLADIRRHTAELAARAAAAPSSSRSMNSTNLKAYQP